ncbi:ATP-binding protein [Amycolatopsis plumensis]
MKRSDATSADRVSAGFSTPIDPSVRSRFEELVPASLREAAVLRRKLGDWLGELPLDAGSSYDILLATYEALANVAAHAYPDRDGWVRLYADWAGDTVTTTVTDTGCGIAAEGHRPPTSGGRGLRLIDEVTDRMTVDTGEHGTQVTMIWRPAALRQHSAS